MRYTVGTDGHDEHGISPVPDGEYATFTEAKRDYIEYLQLERDLWAIALRMARKLTKAEVDDGGEVA
jgi:hypothetical protein